MKKIFVIILSAIMVLTFMPSMAFATEDETDPQGIDLTGAVITLEQDTFTYDGTAHTPVVKSVVKGTDTIDPTNYEVSYINNTNAGKKDQAENPPTVIVKEKNGDENNKSQASVTFTINPKALTENMIKNEFTQEIGAEFALEVKDGEKALTKDTDYIENAVPTTIEEGANNLVDISGKGNYSGNVKVYILGAHLFTGYELKIKDNYTHPEYTGTPKTLLTSDITVEKDGTALDAKYYSISYSDNINAGTNAKVTITGKNGYNGTLTKNFTIDRRSIENCTISTPENWALNQDVNVTVRDKGNGKILEQDKDFVVYTNNAVTSGYIQVAGINNYTGTEDVPIRVVTGVISDYNVILDKSTYEYTGYAITPSVTVKGYDKNNKLVTLSPYRDYKVVYENNTDVSTVTNPAIVRVIGTGDYAGTVEKKFNITKKAFKAENVSLAYDKVVYDGKTKQPAVYVTIDGRTLIKGKDFEVTYGPNVAIGNGTVTVSGIGNYTGYATKTFQIYGEGMEKVRVELSQYSYPYNGKAQTPTVTCYDGTKKLTSADYSVAYKNNTYAGTATVEVTGKGNYAGTKTVEFTIVGTDAPINTKYTKWTKYYPTSEPFSLQATCAADETGLVYTSSNKDVATVSSTGVVTIHNSGVAKITIETVGTKAYNPVSKVCTITVKPLKPVFKLSTPAKGKLKTTVTKEVGATRYEVRYGRTGNYKIKSFLHRDTGYKTTYTTASKLQSGKTYYVKVRAVKVMADGTTVYGNWSATKKIRVQ